MMMLASEEAAEGVWSGGRAWLWIGNRMRGLVREGWGGFGCASLCQISGQMRPVSSA